ncbi:hypothetical protein JCM8097_000277 [Rhodosporidiobolus ruineniae]
MRRSTRTRTPRRQLAARAAAIAAVCASFAAAAPLSSDLTPLPNSTIQLVKQRLAESATDTWVAGTQLEALLELDYPSLSVFSPSGVSYPPPSSPVPTAITSIVSSWAAKRPSWTNQLAYENNGAAGDPAALGVGWLVAAAAEGAEGNSGTQSTYQSQVQQEVNYLLNSVPRTSDGAISHRPSSEAVQLWADFMYMVPPLLAYYGIATSTQSLLEEAYTQCRLYRQYLQSWTSGAGGAWKHIVLGTWQDDGLWDTGNGWAAAGMMRVAATIMGSEYKDELAGEAYQLQVWTNEILTAAFSHIKSDGLLPNYYDSASGSSFSDASGSALLAASAYRLATLNSTAISQDTLDSAATIRAAVNGKVNTQTGWVAPVVNPLSFKDQSSTSPEGEAFVLLLQAAWRDYIEASSASSGPLSALSQLVSDLVSVA